jgi:hypothetical protein
MAITKSSVGQHGPLTNAKVGSGVYDFLKKISHFCTYFFYDGQHFTINTIM